jgi:hypothetical protein
MYSAQDTPCGVGCPIRRPRDHRSLASPPGFSQRATSFIASQCQGIHQMPFLALDPRRFRCGGSKLPPGNAVQHRRAQGQNPHAQRPHMKTLLRTHPARLRRARPPRSHDKLSLHPSNNARRAGWPRTAISPNLLQTPDGAPGWCPRMVPPDGGGERIRTDDLLLAKQALSQLSYTPFQRSEDRGQRSDLSSDLWSLISGTGGPGRI